MQVNIFSGNIPRILPHGLIRTPTSLSATREVAAYENFRSKMTILKITIYFLIAFMQFANAATECNDGVDNDGDGLVDWQNDLGCWGPDDNTEGGLPSGSIDNGWTVYERLPNTRIIYVSSSTGSDSNSGFSPDDPVATIEKGLVLMRSGYPDWLLFKRGDVFPGGFGQWIKDGPSDTQRLVTH